jgi:hypothetical protein
MNKSDLNSSFSVHVSSSEDIFDILKWPYFKVRFVFSEFVFLNGQVISLLVYERWDKEEFVIYDTQFSCSDGKCVNEMDFLERKYYFKLFEIFLVAKPIKL